MRSAMQGIRWFLARSTQQLYNLLSLLFFIGGNSLSLMLNLCNDYFFDGFMAFIEDYIFVWFDAQLFIVEHFYVQPLVNILLLRR